MTRHERVGQIVAQAMRLILLQGTTKAGDLAGESPGSKVEVREWRDDMFRVIIIPPAFSENFGINIYAPKKVLSVFLASDLSTLSSPVFELVSFKRGPWEDAFLAVSGSSDTPIATRH